MLLYPAVKSSFEVSCLQQMAVEQRLRRYKMEQCLCSVCSGMHVGPLVIDRDPFLMVCCPHNLKGGPDTKSVSPTLLPDK